MDFTADFQPYSKGSPLAGGAVLMDFTAEFSSCRRRRRRTTSSSYSRRSSLARSAEWRTGTLDISRTTRRWLAWLLVLLVCTLLVLYLIPGADKMDSTRPSLAEASYLQVVGESQFQPHLGGEVGGKVANLAELAEAGNSLAVALEMKRLGKVDKAARLFSHALALAPRSSIILLQYGEFLQEQKKDLIQADHYFARALAFCPAHDFELRTKAAAKCEETQGKVRSIDESVLDRIDMKKRKFLEIRQNSAALKRAKSEAYFQYIYHTVGIEGNTMSLAQTRSILETKLAVGGKSIMEHNEILGMDAALKYINNTLVDKLGDITLEDILEMHRRVIGNVDPVEAGLFRRTQVWVGDHVPPPPSMVVLLVNKFINWLDTESANNRLHPVRLAALAHYKLVYIHPFVDGNGRTSRLLMNLVLMQAGYPPVIIRRSDRETYYRHLVTANEGDVRPFVRFIAHCTEKTLDAYLWATKEWPEWSGELDSEDGGPSLPANLLENSVEQVHSDLLRRRAALSEVWLGLEGDTVIQGGEELHVIRLGESVSGPGGDLVNVDADL